MKQTGISENVERRTSNAERRSGESDALALRSTFDVRRSTFDVFPRFRRRAFTLIEVMVAVFVVALLAVAINRFIAANLIALKFSTDASAERRAMVGLVNILQTKLIELPPTGQSRLAGVPHKFGEFSSDTLEWGCGSGIGVMTGAASGEYRVVFQVKPIEKTSTVLELGLLRRPVDGTQKDETWLPLMSNVAGLEIRYFHPQLNAKVDRWNDPALVPSLVFVSIWRSATEPPFEAVLTVPVAKLQQQ